MDINKRTHEDKVWILKKVIEVIKIVSLETNLRIFEVYFILNTIQLAIAKGVEIDREWLGEQGFWEIADAMLLNEEEERKVC